MNKILFIGSILMSNSLFAQFSQRIIDTDSSEITITRNSLYKITEEVLNYKDSIWYSVRYIQDTNQIESEGWLDKNMNYLGEWKEYRLDGVWLNTTTHNPFKFTYNDTLYPDHKILENMKLRADSIIQKVYGEVFFTKNVLFEGGCSVYHNSAYIGNWSKPLQDKPNNFMFNYVLDCKSKNYLNLNIRVYVDSSGNGMLNYENGFEKIPERIKKTGFILQRERIINKFLSKHKEITDIANMYEFTNWESSYISKKYNGFYLYNIAVKKGDTTINESHRGKTYSITYYKYKIYRFSLWNGKLKSVQTINTPNDYTNLLYVPSLRWHQVDLDNITNNQ